MAVLLYEEDLRSLLRLFANCTFVVIRGDPNLPISSSGSSRRVEATQIRNLSFSSRTTCLSSMSLMTRFPLHTLRSLNLTLDGGKFIYNDVNVECLRMIIERCARLETLVLSDAASFPSPFTAPDEIEFLDRFLASRVEKPLREFFCLEETEIGSRRFKRVEWRKEKEQEQGPEKWVKSVWKY
ncbi:hypothetical protein JCM8547_008268 [Rhodosporidiobolus lusitaniae]